MKRYIARLQDAFKGALVLAGIYALITILTAYSSVLLPYSGLGLQRFFHFHQWTLIGIKYVFFATTLFGFVLGCCFQALIRKWCPLSVVYVSTILLLLGCFIFLTATHFSIPYEMKLADCRGGKVNIHVKVPVGHYYALNLDAPGLTQMSNSNGFLISSYKFTGHIRITNGTSLIADIPMNSDKMTVISSGFILTGGGFQTNIPSLNRFIHPGKDYDLNIEFNPPPPPSSSISLHWMENAAEKGQ